MSAPEMENDPDPAARAESDDVAWAEQRDADAIAGLFGFDFGDAGSVDRSGLRALVNSALVSHRRLPMLDVIFDRTARLMTTSLRQLTDDNVEVSLDDVTSTRFGDYLQGVPQPSVIGVARAAALNNYCLVAADASLVYSIVDLLLGGRRGVDALTIEDRDFTAIELGLAQRILALLVEDLAEAFAPVAASAFTLDRVETTPRFAAIAQDASVCAMAKFRIRLEGRGGRASIVIPHAALEPVRRTLLQEFIGEESGADASWRRHLAAELAETSFDVRAILAERTISIGALSALQLGDTLTFPLAQGGVIDLKAGGAHLARGRIGRAGDLVAVKLLSPVARAPLSAGEAA